MGLLKVIFILLLVWYVTKLLIRYVLPKAFLHFLRKRGFDTGENYQKPPKEGEMNIKVDHPAGDRKEKDDFGEYVDFEEIKQEQKSEDEQKSKPNQKPGEKE
jgi:hypothetical protein